MYKKNNWLSIIRNEYNPRNQFFLALKRRVDMFIKCKSIISIKVPNLDQPSLYYTINNKFIIDEICSSLKFIFNKLNYKQSNKGLKKLIMTISYGESVDKATSTFITNTIMEIFLKNRNIMYKKNFVTTFIVNEKKEAVINKYSYEYNVSPTLLYFRDFKKLKNNEDIMRLLTEKRCLIINPFLVVLSDLIKTSLLNDLSN